MALGAAVRALRLHHWAKNALVVGADVTAADFTEADLSGTIFRDVKGFAEAKGFDRAAPLSLRQIA